MSKFGLEKKLYSAEIRDFGLLCAFSLTNWLTNWLPHASQRDSSPYFSTTSTCPILKNEAFLESLQHGPCGTQQTGVPTPMGIEFPPLLPPPGGLIQKFPLIFDHFHLPDFEKWGIFGKLTTWSVRHATNWGPHPNGNRVSPPFPPAGGLIKSSPLIFDHFNLSDFEKWRLFGKLKASSIAHATNWGPHPNGNRVFPPFLPL